MRSLRLFILLSFCTCVYGQQDFSAKLVTSALGQTQQEVVYDATYFQIKYPNGDVPAGKGVCTDVVIRSYRGVGIDLQKEVHEDMLRHFASYPKYWNLKKPDSNIDHRRVPNLIVFFRRFGTVLPVSKAAADYQPGDIVCWNLQNKNSDRGITHIGIVSNVRSADGLRYKIVHNIGAGNRLEDMLFDYTIIAHFRYGK